MNSVTSKTYYLTQNENIRMDAEHTAQKFVQLNHLFSRVHNLVSHSRPIKEEDVPQISDAINSYMTAFRQHFPGKVIPKMHILESHVPEWISTHGLGMGVLSEQGGESAHRVFNELRRTFGGIANPVAQLEAMMKDHLMSVHPAISCHSVPQQKRSVKRKL